jgi:hypothetical protein
LSHDIWLVMPDLVLLLFYFQFVLSDLPSTIIGTCLLHQYYAYPYFQYNGHALFCFPIFLRTPLILLLCVECLPFLCHCSHLIGFISLQPLLPL